MSPCTSVVREESSNLAPKNVEKRLGETTGDSYQRRDYRRFVSPPPPPTTTTKTTTTNSRQSMTTSTMTTNKIADLSGPFVPFRFRRHALMGVVSARLPPTSASTKTKKFSLPLTTIIFLPFLLHIDNNFLPPLSRSPSQQFSPFPTSFTLTTITFLPFLLHLDYHFIPSLSPPP